MSVTVDISCPAPRATSPSDFLLTNVSSVLAQTWHLCRVMTKPLLRTRSWAASASGGVGEGCARLVLERSRQELQSPPQEIRLLREAFEALPHAVQHLLMAQPH